MKTLLIFQSTSSSSINLFFLLTVYLSFPTFFIHINFFFLFFFLFLLISVLSLLRFITFVSIINAIGTTNMCMCVCVVCMCKWQKVRFTRKKLIHAFLFVVALGLQIICTSFQKYVFIFKCEKITPNLHAKIRSPNQPSIPPPRFPL